MFRWLQRWYDNRIWVSVHACVFIGACVHVCVCGGGAQHWMSFLVAVHSVFKGQKSPHSLTLAGQRAQGSSCLGLHPAPLFRVALCASLTSAWRRLKSSDSQLRKCLQRRSRLDKGSAVWRTPPHPPVPPGWTKKGWRGAKKEKWRGFYCCLFVCLLRFVLIFFWGGTAGVGRIWGGQEVSRISIHHVKFPKNQ